MRPTDDKRPKLVCGLGNPPEVAPAQSLHNLGFMALESLAFSELELPRWEAIDGALVCSVSLDGRETLLAKPIHVDINSSGVPVRKLMDRFGCEPSEILVVHDDIDLPLGKIKLKLGASEDRHNGVRSVAEELASMEFGRLKGGVGRPPDRSRSILEWVKGAMDPQLAPAVSAFAAKLGRAAKMLCELGVSKGQNSLGRIE